MVSKRQTTAALVAVGIPVFNGEKWLRDTVMSILSQTFRDLDVLIIDNASSDRTADIAQELCAEDRRVRYLRNPTNIGVFRNYDATFRSTSSTYFKWCPVGDQCDPSFVETAVQVLEARDDVSLVHAKTAPLGSLCAEPPGFDVILDLVDDNPAQRFREYLNSVKLNNVMNGLIRSADLHKTCLNRPFHGSDKCMIAELALHGKFVEIPEPLLFRRMEAETATALKDTGQRRVFFAMEPSSSSLMWRWKGEWTLFRGVCRSPLSLRGKLNLTAYIIQRLFWQHRVLAGELREIIFGSK